MMKASPRVIPITPSVAIERRQLDQHDERGADETSREPHENPDDHGGSQRPAWTRNSCAPTTPASAITAPGDRSTPPEMMTMAAPTAAIP